MPRYRKRQPRLKRRMKRAVLNTTSTKKSDTMPPYSSSTNPEIEPQPGALSLVPNPAFFSSTPSPGAPNITIWTPFARLLSTTGPNATHLRTASEIYTRGIAETITIEINDGTAWRWRRIAFCLKGNILRENTYPITYTEPNGSTARTLRNISASPTSSSTSFLQYVALRNTVFRGAITSDWQAIFDAPIDTTKITLISDKVRTLTSGNASSRVIRRKVWTPFNKTLVYNDNENGVSQDTQRWSTVGKPGMGDVYVVDMFSASQYADTTSRMLFNPTTTLYWHER